MGEYWDVNYTGNGYESLIDLDLGEVGNYGADSEVEQFLQSNEETQGYEELRSPSDVDALRIFAKEQILRERERGKSRESLANAISNWPAHLKGEMVFWKCRQTSKMRERERPFEENHV